MSSVGEAVPLMLELVLTSSSFKLGSMESSAECFSIESGFFEVFKTDGLCGGDFLLDFVGWSVVGSWRRRL